MNWKSVWARRLAQHYLLDRAASEGLVGVVDRVCGIHAQIMPAAELSIGIRVDNITRRNVQAALWEKRLLVKTFGIRGTVHLFPSDELPIWMAALRARSGYDTKRQQAIGLDEEQTRTIVGAIGDALDGERLTLKQLGDRVVELAGSWAGEATAPAWGGAWPRWRLCLGDAALAGLLCYGPPEGNEVTFVRADQWTGKPGREWHDIHSSEALTEVFRRYLRAYGPATTRDFAQWFNIPPRAARELAATIEGEVEEVNVEGYRSYVLAEDAGGLKDVDPLSVSEQLPVRLLPHFDCYVIGCHPRDRLLPAAWAERVPPRTIPSQVPVLLVDGTVAGVWERKTKGQRVMIGVEPFGTLDRRQKRLLEDETARIGAFLQLEAGLAIGPVAIRPHL